MEKSFKYLIGGIIFLLLLWVSTVIYFDPYQQFRYTKNGRGEQRILNGGIAKTGNFDTVVLGTSTSEIMLKKDLDETFGGNSVNLSLSGATSFEERKLLELLVDRKDLKEVILALDPFSFNKGIEESRVPLENYAYSKTYFWISRYLFSYKTLEEIIDSVKNPNENWLDRLSYWGDDFKYTREGTLTFDDSTQPGAQNLGVVKELKGGYSIENMKSNFDEVLLLVKENSSINYDMYFPPYADLWWYFADKENQKEKILEFKKYVVESTKDIPNVTIHDFQNVESIISDLNNYKDIVHYSPDIAKMIIKGIKEKSNVLSVNNLNEIYLIDKIVELKKSEYSTLFK